jgi:hypothetical protein
MSGPMRIAEERMLSARYGEAFHSQNPRVRSWPL